MRRITCIGAQSIAVTEQPVQLPSIEMQCRRRSADIRARTFFASPANDVLATPAMQLPLFEESVASSAYHCGM